MAFLCCGRGDVGNCSRSVRGMRRHRKFVRIGGGFVRRLDGDYFRCVLRYYITTYHRPRVPASGAVFLFFRHIDADFPRVLESGSQRRRRGRARWPGLLASRRQGESPAAGGRRKIPPELRTEHASRLRRTLDREKGSGIGHNDIANCGLTIANFLTTAIRNSQSAIHNP